MTDSRSIETTRSRRRVFVFGALWLAVSGAAFATPGCYGRNCDGGVEPFGTEAGEGRMVSEDLWESVPQDGQDWLWFPRQRVYVFNVPAWSGRTPFDPKAYLSAQKRPQAGNYSLAGGNLALFSATGPNRIDVRNDTCSDYYLRLTTLLPPLPSSNAETPPTPELDAGTDDAGTGDAGDAEAGP